MSNVVDVLPAARRCFSSALCAPCSLRARRIRTIKYVTAPTINTATMPSVAPSATACPPGDVGDGKLDAVAAGADVSIGPFSCVTPIVAIDACFMTCTISPASVRGSDQNSKRETDPTKLGGENGMEVKPESGLKERKSDTSVGWVSRGRRRGLAGKGMEKKGAAS